MKKRILSGIRPTGKLHLGHWVGVLSNWVKLQDEYSCFFMVADWHALMSEYKNAHSIRTSITDNVADWIAWGLDPKKCVMFVQSQVGAHIELFMFLSNLVPLGWLYRCPTFKEQMQQLKDKEINTHAFLGYPVLQAADILLYQSHCVPVGEDQLPHLEITREIARRFHFLYKKEVFIEPQAILTPIPKLLGTDGRKMSKSYDNYISLDEDEASLRRKVSSMVTDPERIKKDDPGHPDICNVFSFHQYFAPKIKDDVHDWCMNAKKGCVECKKILADNLWNIFADKKKKKGELLKDKTYIVNVLREGKEKASAFAEKTLAQTRKAVLG